VYCFALLPERPASCIATQNPQRLLFMVRIVAFQLDKMI